MNRTDKQAANMFEPSISTSDDVQSPLTPPPTGEKPCKKIRSQPSSGETQDSVDEQLLPILLEEASELYPLLSEALQAWRKESSEIRRGQKLERLLHTLKGSACMAGAVQLGELTHQMEGRIEEAIARRDFPAGFWDALESFLTRLNQSIQLWQSSLQTAPKEAEPPASSSHLPLSYLNTRLQQVVQQTAKALGKQAELEISGGEMLMERSLLKKLAAPFEHLLRNAVAHGIECPDIRAAQGKPTTGYLHLSAQSNGKKLTFALEDDGAGLDVAIVWQKAQVCGQIAPDETLDAPRACQLIFMPGISTAREVTEISGRGMGLDVVRNEILALGGEVQATSVPGKGMRFALHLPEMLPTDSAYNTPHV